MVPTFSHSHAFSHQMRGAWRWYRCVVKHFGPKDEHTRTVREHLRAMIREV